MQRTKTPKTARRVPRAGLLAALLAAVVLSGCASVATDDPETAEPVATAEATTAVAEESPVVLHLTPDLALASEPPAEAGYVRFGAPAHLPPPFSTGHPSWTGTLPAAITLDAVEVVFHVTTNTATLAAKNADLFFGLPHFYVQMEAGGERFGADAEGPNVVLAGEVHEVRATLAPEEALALAAGNEVTLRVIVVYTHVNEVAEFRFVLGPEHPGAVTIL